MNDQERFLHLVNEVDVDIAGLSIVWGVPESTVKTWFRGEKPAPKWAINYLSLINTLQEIGRLTTTQLGVLMIDDMNKMLDHIGDGPSDPEDAQDPFFDEYSEPDPYDVARQERLEERSGWLLQNGLMIRHITDHGSFDLRDLIAHLKRGGEIISTEDPM